MTLFNPLDTELGTRVAALAEALDDLGQDPDGEASAFLAKRIATEQTEITRLVREGRPRMARAAAVVKANESVHRTYTGARWPKWSAA